MFLRFLLLNNAKKKTNTLINEKNSIDKAKVLHFKHNACTCIYTCYDIVSIMIFCMKFIYAVYLKYSLLEYKMLLMYAVSCFIQEKRLT